MSGWLMKASYPGSSPETPKHVDLWAVWFPAPADAAEAVSKTAGVSDLPTASLCKLPDELLWPRVAKGPVLEGEAVSEPF